MRLDHFYGIFKRLRLPSRLLIASSSLTLFACATLPTPSCDGNPLNARANDVAGTQWVLIRWHQARSESGLMKERNTSRGQTLSLQFSKDGQQVSGHTGCNSFTGPMQTMQGQLIGSLATTRKACDPHVMDLEIRYLSYLKDYRSLLRDQDRLILIARDGEVLSFGLQQSR